MAHAEAFPPYYPTEARRAFGNDDALRRMAKVARFAAGSRLLHLGCGAGEGTVFLAKDTGATVLAADVDAGILEQVKERARTHRLAERVQIRVIDYKKLPFSDEEFDGVVLDGPPPLRLDAAVKSLRRLLAPKGRLCLVYPVKVGRQQPPAVLTFWEKRLGESLRMPREALELMESAGYEPQSIEALPDVELDDLYHSVEAHLPSVTDGARLQSLKDEIALHREQDAGASVTFAQLIGRRKEPGEKPPPSRSDG